MSTQLTTDVYKGLSKETRGQLVYLAGEIKRTTGRATEAFLELCSLYAQAHEEFAKAGREGGFKDWVESKCGVTRQTAYNYLSVYKRFGSVKPVLQLNPISLIKLSAKNVPDSAVEEALELAKTGKLTKAETEKVIERHKPEPPTPKPAPEPIVDAEWERVEVEEEPDDEDDETAVLSQSTAPRVDQVVERARAAVPELCRKLAFNLGNLGANGRFDKYFREMEEFAR